MHDVASTHRFWLLAALGGLVTLVGVAAAHFMESHGHIVTGMGNEVVWGTPHVFAVFMIVAASGVLNMASVGSVFGQPAYKARAKLSGLLSLALLAGGLMVLMLDLGRPERVLVAAHGNSLRALVMVLEKLSPEQILKREIGTGVPIIYRLGADALVTSKLDLAA